MDAPDRAPVAHRASVMRDPLSRHRLTVPASIANLGPGFDTLGVAVDLYLTLDIEPAPGCGSLAFSFDGQPPDGENFIERAFHFLAVQRTADRSNDWPSLHVTVRSDIPQRSGLGSSAAATIAGLRLYEAVTGPLSRDGLLNAACALEHHPDNVAAALLGGLTASCQLPDRSVIARRLPWPRELRLLVATPAIPLSTAESRRALPEMLTREDAVFNLQRLTLLLHSLASHDYSLLTEALQDRWHQTYRQHLVPGLEGALTLRHPDILGICLAGAGPSIVAFATQNFDAAEAALASVFDAEGIPFTLRRLSVHQ